MDGWTGWHWFTVIQGSSAPVLARNDDGRLGAFLLDADGSLRHNFEEKPDGQWSSNWGNLNPGRPVLVQPQIGPVLAANADGRLEAFVYENGKISHIWQNIVNGGLRWDWHKYDEIIGDTIEAHNARVSRPSYPPIDWTFPFSLESSVSYTGWSGWQDFEPISTTLPFAVARNAAGCLELFVVNDSHELCHKRQLTTFFPSKYQREISWSAGWEVLANGVWSRFFVLRRPNGALEVLGWDGNGLAQLVQTGPNLAWSSPSYYCMVTNMPKEIVAWARNGAGGLDIFLKERHGTAILQRSMKPTSTVEEDYYWTCDSPVAPLTKVGEAAGKVMVIRNGNGCQELFASGVEVKRYYHPKLPPDKKVILGRKRQLSPGGDWSQDWETVSICPDDFTLARTQDGRLVIAARYKTEVGYCQQLPWEDLLV